jgi:hypothetical protein
MKETMKKLEAISAQAREAAASEAGKPIFKRFGGSKGMGFQEPVSALKEIGDSCQGLTIL